MEAPETRPLTQWFFLSFYLAHVENSEQLTTAIRFGLIIPKTVVNFATELGGQANRILQAKLQKRFEAVGVLVQTMNTRLETFTPTGIWSGALPRLGRHCLVGIDHGSKRIGVASDATYHDHLRTVDRPRNCMLS